MNRVDFLQEEIHDIQTKCPHEFEVVDAPILLETLVEGIYVGIANGQIRFPKDDPRARQQYKPRFALKCSKCSKALDASIIGTCPKCFSSMKRWEQLDLREKYFGTDYIYYAVRLYSCSRGQECSIPVFTVAVDEWDQ